MPHGQSSEGKGWRDRPQPNCLVEVVLERIIMNDENNLLQTGNTEEPNNDNPNGAPDGQPNNTSDGEQFDISKYEKNLEDNSTSEEILRYQTLIKNQDQLIATQREENKLLKEKNLSLATSMSTVDNAQKPQSTEDILAAAFL